MINLIAICIFLIQCSKEETLPSNDYLIFSTSYPIEISAYEYQDNEGNVYQVQGDTSFALIADTVGDSPVLAWEAIPFRYVTAALFSNPISVSGGEIQNVEDIVWQWHSGMDFGVVGQVQYSEGRSVINEIIDYNNFPVSLTGGHYYWAVWAWGNAGVRVLFSSQQREFYVLK